MMATSPALPWNGLANLANGFHPRWASFFKLFGVNDPTAIPAPSDRRHTTPSPLTHVERFGSPGGQAKIDGILGRIACPWDPIMRGHFNRECSLGRFAAPAMSFCNGCERKWSQTVARFASYSIGRAVVASACRTPSSASCARVTVRWQAGNPGSSRVPCLPFRLRYGGSTARY
jgi:hypothetical protein